GAEPRAAHEQGHPAAGGPHRDPAHGGLHGADHQEHLAGLGGRLRGAGARRTDRQQHHLPALRDLSAHRFSVFPDVLSALDIEQEAGEQGWRPILCLTPTRLRPAKWWCACWACIKNSATTKCCAASTWKSAAAKWSPSSAA